MWISVRSLRLGVVILWSTILCSGSGLVVGTDRGMDTEILQDDPTLGGEVSGRGARPREREELQGLLIGTGEVISPSDDEDNLSCTELRSRKYISDGYCTSARPITEVVCAGECVPSSLLDQGAEYKKLWAATKTKDWRCVDDVVRNRRVHLLCENGETRTYRIRTVKSCKCKQYAKVHNQPPINQIIDENEEEDTRSKDERRQDRRNLRDNPEGNNRQPDRKKRHVRTHEEDTIPSS